MINCRMENYQRAIARVLLVSFFAASGCGFVAKGKANENLSLPYMASAPWFVVGPLSVSQESGYEILTNEKVIANDVTRATTQYGEPQAIELISGYQFVLFWKQPARTLIFRLSDSLLDKWEPVIDLNAVPRSVRRLGFGEGPLPPPWPVTMPTGDALLSPPWPSEMSKLHRGIFASVACPRSFPQPFPDSERPALGTDQSRVTLASGPSAQRAETIFARLIPLAAGHDVKWRLLVFAKSEIPGSEDVWNFRRVDGSIFLSVKLVEQFSDVELTALLAHEMAEILYYLPPNFLLPRAALGLPKNYLGGPPYDKAEEIEADYLASEYLARLEIAPDALFDALVKLYMLRPDTAYGPYVRMSAVCFGKLLDAGMIPGQKFLARSILSGGGDNASTRVDRGDSH